MQGHLFIKLACCLPIGISVGPNGRKTRTSSFLQDLPEMAVKIPLQVFSASCRSFMVQELFHCLEKGLKAGICADKLHMDTAMRKYKSCDSLITVIDELSPCTRPCRILQDSSATNVGSRQRMHGNAVDHIGSDICGKSTRQQIIIKAVHCH